MIIAFKNQTPRIQDAAFIADGTHLIGQVILAKDTSVWYGSVLRGDVASITVGKCSNIQDLCIVHVDDGLPTLIGEYVTIGHGAILHACTIGDRSLIGMGATILNKAVIAEDCIVGACALITEGKTFPPRSLILGSPAKVVRQLTDAEVADLKKHAIDYLALALENASGVRHTEKLRH